MSSNPLTLRQSTFHSGSPAVMAIVNLTPDSFYQGARYDGVAPALRAASRHVRAGADIIDVGAVRAGQEGDWVSPEDEVRRLLPFLRELRQSYPEILISVDTWRSEVLEELRSVRIDLVNDTWQGYDPKLAHVAAELRAGYVCSHSGGLPPRTDPKNAAYPPEPDGVVEDVLKVLRRSAKVAVDAGVPPHRVIVDPTLDFGKTTSHSLTLLRHTGRVASLGYPVLQAISRKDFVGESLGREVADRLSGSLAATAIASWLGACIFRTHDVAATRDVVDMVTMIAGRARPRSPRRGVAGQS